MPATVDGAMRRWLDDYWFAVFFVVLLGVLAALKLAGLI